MEKRFQGLIGLSLLVSITSCTNESKSNFKSGTTQSGFQIKKPQSGSVALNPAHGQPGHDCKIPVGAPLNSASSSVIKPNFNAANSPRLGQNTPVSALTTQSVPVTSAGEAVKNVTAATARVNTAVGVNPPHGQPNHRCDIAVGAPLNSAPTKTATTPVKTITPLQTAVKTAPGMNPPHGQSGHRCDIAVGAPLNSATAKPAVTSGSATDPILNPIPNTITPTPETPVKKAEN